MKLYLRCDVCGATELAQDTMRNNVAWPQEWQETLGKTFCLKCQDHVTKYIKNLVKNAEEK